jgi:hypothetical protein
LTAQGADPHSRNLSLGASNPLARSKLRHFEREGLVKILPLTVPIELPAVGNITVAAGRTR